MNNKLLFYFEDISEEVSIKEITHFDKLGLFNPLIFRIEKTNE